MSERPYRRSLLELPKLWVATLALVALAVVTWAVAVALSALAGWDVEFVGPVLLALLVAAVICAGVQLNRYEPIWVRAIGVTLVVCAVTAVVLVAASLWFVAELCENGCN